MKFTFEGQSAFVPGAVRGIGTAIVAAFLGAGAKVIIVDILKEETAMRRLGEPSDIAHAVLFLASGYASAELPARLNSVDVIAQV